MKNSTTEEKESIARDLGHASYADAPPAVRRNIDASLADGHVTATDDPAGALVDAIVPEDR